MKRSELRLAAEQDIENGFTHYFNNASQTVASRFIEAVDSAIKHIEQHPGSGSPRFAELLGNSELRSWLLNDFPYTLFYVERIDHIDVIRVLHQHSDIPIQLHKE